MGHVSRTRSFSNVVLVDTCTILSDDVRTRFAVRFLSESERDYLGGSAAKGSDLYARVARNKISNTQRVVIFIFQSSAEDDLVGEHETALQ